jgi:amino acid permease
MIGVIIYFVGVAVQYVRVNTVHRQWKEERIRYSDSIYAPPITPYLAIWGSWLAFILMFIKSFLDKRFINKKIK